MTRLTVSDYADTGQWRLKINIYEGGMDASLENTLHDDVEPQFLFKTSWDKNDGFFLKHIEDTVYSNPRVLDDFSSKIILYNPDVIFMPTAYAEENEGNEEECYNLLYPSESADIMTEVDKDVTCVWNPGKGVKSFLMRTFPGSVVTTNLMNLFKEYRKVSSQKRLIVYRRKDETDYIALDGSRLLGGVTHQTSSEADMAYHALNIAAVLNLELSETLLSIAGEEISEEARLALAAFKRE